MFADSLVSDLLSVRNAAEAFDCEVAGVSIKTLVEVIFVTIVALMGAFRAARLGLRATVFTAGLVGRAVWWVCGRATRPPDEIETAVLAALAGDITYDEKLDRITAGTVSANPNQGAILVWVGMHRVEDRLGRAALRSIKRLINEARADHDAMMALLEREKILVELRREGEIAATYQARGREIAAKAKVVA